MLGPLPPVDVDRLLAPRAEVGVGPSGEGLRRPVPHRQLALTRGEPGGTGTWYSCCAITATISAPQGRRSCESRTLGAPSVRDPWVAPSSARRAGTRRPRRGAGRPRGAANRSPSRPTRDRGRFSPRTPARARQRASAGPGATQVGSCARRMASGSEPCPSTASWNALQVEPVAVACLELAPQRLDLALAGHVGKRLAGPRDVAVGLGLGLQLRSGRPRRAAASMLRSRSQRNAWMPGVDDQARRAPRLRLEHPEALAGVVVEAHLVGEALAVEAPALDVGAARESRAEAAERGQAGDAPPRARSGSDGRGPPRGRWSRRADGAAASRVERVDEVDARPRAVRRGREVERGRCLLLLVRLDGPHLHRATPADARTSGARPRWCGRPGRPRCRTMSAGSVAWLAASVLEEGAQRRRRRDARARCAIDRISAPIASIRARPYSWMARGPRRAWCTARIEVAVHRVTVGQPADAVTGTGAPADKSSSAAPKRARAGVDVRAQRIADALAVGLGQLRVGDQQRRLVDGALHGRRTWAMRALHGLGCGGPAGRATLAAGSRCGRRAGAGIARPGAPAAVRCRSGRVDPLDARQLAGQRLGARQLVDRIDCHRSRLAAARRRDPR